MHVKTSKELGWSRLLLLKLVCTLDSLGVFMSTEAWVPTHRGSDLIGWGVAE